MRYLGNKESIIDEIQLFFREKKLLNKKYKFFDAFCGTGSVANAFKDTFDIVINDNLKWAELYTNGRLVSSNCKFKNLGFNPIDYLNSSDNKRKGFIYNNYAPEISNRMYFTPENAMRIDYFRYQIEQWKIQRKIDDNEYSYLITCLINAVSDVSNTAGVYGAFLKKWDSRALKPIVLSDMKDNIKIKKESVERYNSKLEDIIENIECDIIYLDPPYTQNQYGTQYHLLETLVLDDNPEISEITGSRKTAPMRSDWSKEYKVNILLDKIISKTKAKYIVLSYSNHGLMSKEFIEACFKRYGIESTYSCKKIRYKKYENWKSTNDKDNYEYLFFIEKKPENQVVYESPLNYIGSKTKLVNDIKKYLPNEYGDFYDIFGGGFNVGINVKNHNVIYNDINHFVKEIIESIDNKDTYLFIKEVKKYIYQFGLEKGNKEAYLKARNYYNHSTKSKKNPILLFTIIMYGFQQQIRFNSSHEFNNPAGVRWFNEKILEKLISFSRVIKEECNLYYSKDYIKVIDNVKENDFVYLDPPYMLTTGSYNDGKRGFNGWNLELEEQLMTQLNKLNNNKIKFMLSYVIEHKSKTNSKITNWVKENNYRIIELEKIRGISGSIRKEVLIINYEKL